MFNYNINFDNLFSRKCFCLWKYEKLKDFSRPSKVPYYYNGSKLVKANIKKRSCWINGYEAIQVFKMRSDVDGIGLILINSNLFGIDLDNCFDTQTNKLLPYADSIVQQFSDTYIEISPSGKGLHILGKGKLNFERSKSPINKFIEAYDGSSVRYLTVTGILFNNKTVLCEYHPSSPILKWFQENFFPPSSISQKLSNHQGIKQSNSHHQQSAKVGYLNTIISQIQNSTDNQLFNQLCQGFKVKNSPSEDDWLFCKVVLNHTQENDEIVIKELIKQMLLKYRYRPKIKRLDYINRTIDKVFQIASQKNIAQKQLGIPFETHLTQLKHISIPSSHIIKVCPMIQSMFTLSKEKYSSFREYKIQPKKNDNSNYIIIKSMYSLDVKDLSIYTALTKLLKTKTFVAESSCSNEWIDDRLEAFEYMRLKVNFGELSKILKQADGGSFRKSVLNTIRTLSNVMIEYKKIVNRKNKVVEGQSNLLNWFAKADDKMGRHIYIGINKLNWTILQEATINYCLLNTNVMFRLPSLQLRWLYSYLCRKVFPGSHQCTKISINALVKNMWPVQLNRKAQNLRKIRARKLCQQLYDLQESLVDFTIELISDQKKNSYYQTITHIHVKRYRVHLERSLTEVENQQLEIKKELSEDINPSIQQLPPYMLEDIPF